MATYKLIPSSLTADVTISDPSNAYSDTDSTTYVILSGFNDAYLGGFTTLPLVENVTSVVVKLKAKVRLADQGYKLQATLMSAPNGIALSNTVNIGTTSETPYTFTLTASAETVASYVDTLCIHLYNVYGQHVVYGADVTIEADLKIFNNKIIYGGETLIDLTGDTATEADVASGKTFHLASGIQATGTLIASPTSKNSATTSTTVRIVSFTGLTKEPSYFWIMPMIASATRSYRVMGVVYNGTTTYTLYTDGTSAGKLVRSTSVGTWTYSDGTLKFMVVSPAYLGEATWYIWYL